MRFPCSLGQCTTSRPGRQPPRRPALPSPLRGRSLRPPRLRNLLDPEPQAFVARKRKSDRAKLRCLGRLETTSRQRPGIGHEGCKRETPAWTRRPQGGTLAKTPPRAQPAKRPCAKGKGTGRTNNFRKSGGKGTRKACCPERCKRRIPPFCSIMRRTMKVPSRRTPTRASCSNKCSYGVPLRMIEENSTPL